MKLNVLSKLVKKKLNGIPKNAPVERNECGSDVCVPHK